VYTIRIIIWREVESKTPLFGLRSSALRTIGAVLTPDLKAECNPEDIFALGLDTFPRHMPHPTLRFYSNAPLIRSELWITNSPILLSETDQSGRTFYDGFMTNPRILQKML